MNPRIVITFLVCLLGSSTLAINLSDDIWQNYNATDIYPAYDTSNCVFPFTYNGITFNNCTIYGDNGYRPWCSLTSDYIGLFKYCFDFWKTTLQCQLPFTLNQKTYTEPSYLSTRLPQFKQCKTGNPKYPYRYAIEQHVKKSGQPLLHSDNCDPAYRAMSPSHSKCAGPSDFAFPFNLTDSNKQDLVDLHNSYRAAVGSRCMFKLYWDDTLAQMAQVHGNMCAFDHDQANNRLTLSYKWKNGQNMVFVIGTVAAITDPFIQMYDDEKARFVYGVGCTTPGSCTHYTQLMLSNMTRMGCAVTDCLYPDRCERLLTCNYIHSQYTNNYMIPYVPSDQPGIDCPNTKDASGLCDCGNKICNYDQGEYMDPNTCNCLSGSKKRSVDESDEDLAALELELAGGSQIFSALPSGNNVDSSPELEDKREMRILHGSREHGKRNYHIL